MSAKKNKNANKTPESAEEINQKNSVETEASSGQKETGDVTLTKEEFDQVHAHIEELQKEKDETVVLLQRTQADFENYRRRNAYVRTDSLEEGKRDCITALLPVIDNFDRAFDTECSDENWKKGMELVHRQLVDGLTKLGLSEIDASGKFDPNYHNAVMQEKVEGKESGDILQVFQKGYRVGDKIIRYSMVKVAE